jgi:hypothetical protein
MPRPRLGRARLCSLLILAILLGLFVPFGYGAEQTPTAKIVNVESPSSIHPREHFAVVVDVDYSASYSTDIAILDAQTGFVLDCRGLIIPAGRNVFTFSLTGRDEPGVWKLQATVRVWWHNGWYAPPDNSVFRFETTVLSPVKTELRLRSNIASVEMTVDGMQYSLPTSETQLSIAPGFHTISTEPVIEFGNGTRVVFDHWSDGIRASTRRVYVYGYAELTATYLTE